ncbi:hypothetical protein EJ04DRAFT_570117 [Polyplosphaeria fusca]|uniref:Uncharacterized protein n=1 Tax=Polyplosphaeria fusca TaxID=682080 RepID=A0A9P4QI45_9PLEO|nr:hypothetical protein EJ04DRAFT_570117 [Polyplosphaeria fusca]
MLFPLIELDPETINIILKSAFKSTEVNAFLLAPSSHTDLPKFESGKLHQGNEPPIPSHYKSHWLGKKIDDVAEWMRNVPEDRDVDHHFFAVLDKSAKEGKVVICRIGGRDLKDVGDVDWMRFDAQDAALKLRTAEPGEWEREKERKGDDKIEY